MAKTKKRKQNIGISEEQIKLAIFTLLKHYRGIPHIRLTDIYSTISSILNIYRAHYFPPAVIKYLKALAEDSITKELKPIDYWYQMTNAFIDMFSVIKFSQETHIDRKIVETILNRLYGIQSARFKKTGNLFAFLVYNAVRYAIGKNVISTRDFVVLFDYISQNKFDSPQEIITAFNIYLDLLKKIIKENTTPNGRIIYDTRNYKVITSGCNDDLAFFSVEGFLRDFGFRIDKNKIIEITDHMQTQWLIDFKRRVIYLMKKYNYRAELRVYASRYGFNFEVLKREADIYYRILGDLIFESLSKAFLRFVKETKKQNVYRRFGFGDRLEDIDFELTLQIFPKLSPLFLYLKLKEGNGEIKTRIQTDVRITVIVDASGSMAKHDNIYKAVSIAYALARFSVDNKVPFKIIYFQTEAIEGDVHKLIDFEFPRPYGGTLISSVRPLIPPELDERDIVFIISDFVLADTLSELYDLLAKLEKARAVYLISVIDPDNENIKVFGSGHNVYYTTFEAIKNRKALSKDLFRAIVDID